MARLVKKTAHAPMLVGESKICMCGLSNNQPFCDKSHLNTLKEDDGKLYWYEGDKMEEVITEADDCCDGGECCGKCSCDKNNQLHSDKNEK